MLERAREKEWCLDHHFVSPNESLALDSRVKNVVLVRVEEVWAWKARKEKKDKSNEKWWACCSRQRECGVQRPRSWGMSGVS